MNFFKSILRWFTTKLWFEKVFLIIILLRPIIEPFYYLKSQSILFSPLYWIAFITFFISIIGIFSNSKYKSNLDYSFSFWTIFVLLNLFFLYFSTTIIDYVILFLKLIYPVIIFYFLRGLIKTKEDFKNILSFFLLSSLTAFLWLIYDIGQNGFNLRLKSSFADVVNYGLYANMGFLIISYFFISKKENFLSKNTRITLFIIILILVVLTHFAIKHLSSIGVTVLILAFFQWYSLKKNISNFFFAFLLICSLFFGIADKIYQQVIQERIVKEVEIVEGTRAKSQALHGRATRWDWLWKEFTKQSLPVQLVGFPTSIQKSEYMIGITPHNDFLRILFFTGFFGLICYLYFLFSVLKLIKYFLFYERFLLYTGFFMYIIYSFSTVPTFYPGFNNFIFSLFAICALPIKKAHEE
ncbi:MAG: hypothetical protein HYU67_05565 [Flavobacteriia bacterium]|nr:hypothetical protein [Flavobacteriia bacterium]